jgi:prephenate dehydratase
MSMGSRVQEPEYAAAFQGSRGAFSEVASWELVGADARLLPCPRLEEVFAAVESGQARCGVIPVENTLAGSIHLSFDLLNTHNLVINGEIVCRISHAVVGASGSRLSDIRRILSHPVALAQCERFFREHPEIQPGPEFDTAGAVEKVVREKLMDAAAIAGRRNADLYGGAVLADNIQDHAENFTRFLLIARQAIAPPTGSRLKTTIVFKLGNTPGALFRALRPLAERGIDLTKIESRPIKGSPFEYFFYADLVTAAGAEKAARDAVADLSGFCASLRVLGTYPVNETIR